MSEYWPRITVITPSFNQAPFLEATIQSVLSQEYPNLQYAIVDGGSTDGSAEIIERYRDRLDFVVIEPDDGQSSAINKGFARADGKILAWLCSDDMYTPGALRSVGRFFADHPKAHWVIGHCRHVDPQGNLLEPSPARGVEANPTLADLLLGREGICFPQPGSFWHRTIQEQAGPINPMLHYQMDYDLWCRFLLAGHRPKLLDRELAFYRLHELSKTCSVPHRFLRERIRLRSHYARYLPLPDRIRLARLIGYLRRSYTIETTTGRPWKMVLRRPWWLASQQVREALWRSTGKAA